MAKWLDKLKEDPRVFEVSDESDRGDGFWVYLKVGFTNPNLGCHLIHEWTKQDVMADFNVIEKCDCEDCLEGVEPVRIFVDNLPNI